MPISDSEYEEWLVSEDRQPVSVVHFDGYDADDDPVVLRAADRRYRLDDYDHRARLVEMDVLFELESGLFTETHTDTARVLLANVEGGVDDWRDWRDIRLTTFTHYRGDMRWPLSDFRVAFDGEVYNVQGDHDQLDITVASRVNRVNVTIKDGDFTFPGGGLPGTVAKSYLTDASGGLFTLADLDEDSFDAVDTAFPYLIDVDPDAVQENYLGLVDRSFSGLPLDLCVRRDGLLYVAEFQKPSGASDIQTFRPIGRPEIETVWPLGEITVKNTTSVDSHESFRENTDIKEQYPNNWRSMTVETEFVHADRETHTEALGDFILELYDRPFDRVRFDTLRDLSRLNLGDEIAVQFPRYGYDEGRYGITTLMRDRKSRVNTIEIWV